MLYILLCIKLFLFNNFFFFFDNIFFDNIFTYIYLFSTKLYVYIAIVMLFQLLHVMLKKHVYCNAVLLLLSYYLFVTIFIFFKLVQFKFFNLVSDVNFFFYISNASFFSFQNFPLFSSVHSVLVVSVIYGVTLLLIVLLSTNVFFFLKKNYDYDQFKNYVFILPLILLLGSL